MSRDALPMSILDRKNVQTFAWALMMSGLVGILYFCTAARDIVVGDSPELTMAAVSLGVAHPPGYPLFTMIGHLFGLTLAGPIPFRVNLLSVVCDSLTVGLIFVTAFSLTRSRVASAVAALVLALNSLFWSWSLVAEVFPLNNLLASLLICLLVIWFEQADRTRILAAAFFVGGLACTNHQTIVLLAPAICFLFWRKRAILLRRRVAAICVVAFLLGLLPYLYIPWAAARHPAYNWGEISSFRDFIAVVTRRSYGTFHLTGASHSGGSSLARIRALSISFGPLLGVLTLLGFFSAYRRCRWYFWFSLLALICAGPLFAIITNLNLASTPQTIFVLERFFLFPLVIAAPLSAFGLIAIADLTNLYAPKFSKRSFSIASAAIGIALVAGLLTNCRRIDQSSNHVARLYAEDVFSSLEPGTILLTTGDGLSLPLMYLHIIERVRPDVSLVLPLLLPARWYVRQLREQNPSLTIPFDQYDFEHNNLKALIDANPGRSVAIVGHLRDNSLDRDYWVYLYGLVKLLEPRSHTIKLSQMVRDTDRLMQTYRPPSPEKIHWKTFESEILALYAEPSWKIGDVYEQGGQKEDAHAWYEQALKLDPTFIDASEGLARTR